MVECLSTPYNIAPGVGYFLHSALTVFLGCYYYLLRYVFSTFENMRRARAGAQKIEVVGIYSRNLQFR